MGFPGGASGKESTCQCRRCKRCEFDPWVGKIPWRRARQSTPVFLPRESHGQRSLAGYSPWGNIESDATEHNDIKSQVMKFWKSGALMFKGRGIWMSQLKHRERTCPSSAFLFYLGFQWIGWGLPTQIKEIFFTNSTYSQENLFQKHVTDILRNVLQAIWAPLAQFGT